VSTSPAIMASSESGAPAAASAAYPFTRLMYWCVRREFWENRSIYIAPFTAAGLLIFVVLITVIEAGINAQPLSGDAGEGIGGTLLWIPYMFIAAPVLAIGVFVAIAFCLGALHGERRDRSILFWKSLPVSDLTTVLSKACVPILLIPLISFVAATVAQLAIYAMMLPLFAAKAHLIWAGVPVDYHTMRMLWAGVPIGYLTLVMLYGLLATALWHAPVYAWLLLVGGWARRMTLVWAVAPIAGLMIVERIAFGTDRLITMLQHRLDGSISIAFTQVLNGPVRGNYALNKLPGLPGLTPGRFLTDPGLWIGLAVAALFLGAAVLLRRYRQPI
jgi:ABC-2 type transport system permease protein